MSDLDLTDEEKAVEAGEAEAPEEAAPPQEEPAQEPETPEEQDAEIASERGEEPKKGFVPLTALDAERHKRKDAEARFADIERQYAETRTLLEKLTAVREPQKPDEMPDPALSPVEFQAWLDKRLTAQSQPVQQMQEHQRQAQERQRAMQTLQGYASQHEQAFRTEHKDYDDALSFARSQRADEYVNVWGMDPASAKQAVAGEESQIVAIAAQQGISPAAVVYNYALSRGYGKKPADAGERIERLGETQKRTQSAANASGSAPDGEWTVEKLARLSEAELAKLDDSIIRKAMGG